MYLFKVLLEFVEIQLRVLVTVNVQKLGLRAWRCPKQSEQCNQCEGECKLFNIEELDVAMQAQKTSKGGTQQRTLCRAIAYSSSRKCS